MPGFDKRPPMTSLKQVVPPPRRAYVEKGIHMSNIVLDTGMHMTEPLVENSEMLSTAHHQECHQLTRHMITYRLQEPLLSSQKKEA